MVKILGYNGTTKVVTVSPAFSAVPVGNLEILNFSYDNMCPFSYYGSLTSQQQMSCYEIELINICLPNKTLKTGQGSRIAFYPYVYVEIANISGASAGVNNAIYSNNPNAVKMMFRAPVDDVTNPVISAFIKIDGDGMVQTLKFKPNDNLKFSVHLPNGDVFKTLDEDTTSPQEPNLEVQISACFRILRVT